MGVNLVVNPTVEVDRNVVVDSTLDLGADCSAVRAWLRYRSSPVGDFQGSSVGSSSYVAVMVNGGVNDYVNVNESRLLMFFVNLPALVLVRNENARSAEFLTPPQTSPTS